MDEKSDQIAMSKDELVGRFYAERRSILGHVWHLLPSRDKGDDIFQEACLKFLKAPATFNSIREAAGYFHKTIRSIAVDDLKRESRFVDRRRLPELVCEPEPEWQKQMITQRLRQAAAKLPRRDRVLLAIYMSESRRLCRILNMPTSTYRYRVNKTMIRLRRLLTASSNNHGRTFTNSIRRN